MSQPFRTDALRPSSLPSANLGRRNPHTQSSLGIDGTALTVALAGESGSDDSSERKKALLEVEYQKWNERIDRDVSGVIGGLKDIISLADITSNPTDLTSTTLPLHLPLRTSSLIRSSTNLRDIAHELKLLLVLGDSSRSVQLRDEEFKVVREEVRRGREGIMDLFSTTPTAAAEDAAGAAEGAVDLHRISNEVGNQVKDASEPTTTTATATAIEDGQSVQIQAEEEDKGNSTPIPRSTEVPSEVNMDINPSPSASTSALPAVTAATASPTDYVQTYSTADQVIEQADEDDDDDDFEEVS